MIDSLKLIAAEYRRAGSTPLVSRVHRRVSGSEGSTGTGLFQSNAILNFDDARERHFAVAVFLALALKRGRRRDQRIGAGER